MKRTYRKKKILYQLRFYFTIPSTVSQRSWWITRQEEVLQNWQNAKSLHRNCYIIQIHCGNNCINVIYLFIRKTLFSVILRLFDLAWTYVQYCKITCVLSRSIRVAFVSNSYTPKCVLYINRILASDSWHWECTVSNQISTILGNMNWFLPGTELRFRILYRNDNCH